MGVATNVGERNRKIDHEVKEIHTQIKRSNMILRERMKDPRVELEQWQDGQDDTRNGDMC